MSNKRGEYEIINETFISASGRVGLEFDNIEPINNLIDQITGEYNNNVLEQLRTVEALQGKLRFSSLSLTDELNQCYASVARQNRSLNNFKEQLNNYVRKVKETEDRIIEQLGKIKLDTGPELPDFISATKPEAIVIVSKDAVDVPEKEEEESALEWFNNLVNDTCNQLLDTFSKSADWMTTSVKKMKEKVKDLGLGDSPFQLLDDLLNQMIDTKATVLETLHIPDYNIFDGLVSIIDGYQEVRDDVCKSIYDLDIPVFSDFVGAYGGEAVEGSNLFTIIGSVARGIWVEGAEETVEGIIQIAANPLETVQGVTHILAYPKESAEAIAKGVMDFVNDKIIKGTPEDRACVVGQVVFEAVTWLIGAGEAKNAKAVASIDALEGLNVKAIEKILKRLDDANLEKALKNLSKDQIDTLLKECDSKLAEKIKKIKKITKGGSKSIDDIIESVENGDIPLANNLQKGNYGEMKMDQYYESQGYERINLDKVTDLDSPSHQGIDGVYYNPDGHPPYVIAEAKYGSGKLGNTRDGMQMSDTWINGSDRLVNAVGKDTADDILLEGYGKTLVNVSTDGTISIKNLD